MNSSIFAYGEKLKMKDEDIKQVPDSAKLVAQHSRTQTRAQARCKL